MGVDPVAVCDLLDDSVVGLAEDGVVVYANTASERIAAGELIAQLAPVIERVRASGEREIEEQHDVAHDRWYRHQIIRHRDHVYVVSTDISEHKQAERRLAALARASHAFARPLELDDLFHEIARSLAEIVGDGCVVREIDGAQLRTVALHHVDPDGLERYHVFFGKPLGINEGLAAKVYATGQALLVTELDRGQLQKSFDNDLHREAIGRSKAHSVIAVPLRDGERRFGLVMMVRDRTARAYTENDLALLQDLADRASLFIENARVLDAERLARHAAERIAEQTRRLHAIASQLSHRRQARDVAETVLRESAAVLGDATGAIWLLADSSDRLDMLASLGYPARYASMPLASTSPLCASVRAGEPVYLSTIKEYAAQFAESAARIVAEAPPELATACLPLIVEGQAIGGLVISWPHANPFVPDERRFLELLADQCAQAIDRSRLLEQERAASAAARDADRRKDEFLAMLGHELRNPLAPIRTALDLMKLRGEKGGEHERALIERQTKHLVRLVDDLLDISRITRGKLELDKRRVDVASVLAQAIEMASPLLEERGHLLQLSAHRGVLYVEGDELRLAQVFQNLLTNAAKYTPPGGKIGVHARMDGDIVVAEISDNGEGIPAQMLPRMFEPFVQGVRGVDRSQGGLGVGLALVRSLVALHGGRVEARSEGAGRGSTFVVHLPLAPRPAAELETTIEPPRIVRTSLRRRILLVDDNQDAAELLASLLREAGHEVVVAYDGPTALGAVPAFRPDVALLDIGLPIMDGYDLAAKLRTLLPDGARFVALTGYGQEHDRRRSRAAGFAAHLVKPVEAAIVLAAVDDLTR